MKYEHIPLEFKSDYELQLEKEKAELEHYKAFHDNLILSLRNDVERLEQLMQGLTLEQLRRCRDAFKNEDICELCLNRDKCFESLTRCNDKNCIGCEEENSCPLNNCIVTGEFKFFNDSEGENK